MGKPTVVAPGENIAPQDAAPESRSRRLPKCMTSAAAAAEVHESRWLLRVTVIEAQNLRKLDLMRTTDPYCFVFLEDERGKPGEIIYRTEVVPQTRDPVFNEEFLFSLYPGVQNVSVLIYDDDPIMDDDVIGSVQVNLESLDPGVPIEKWVPVQNSERREYIKGCKMRLQLTLQPANADFDSGSMKTHRTSVDLHLPKTSQMHLRAKIKSDKSRSSAIY